ncbi:hypothetical protein DPMN_044975 [Dreissena polymorpha]|uniref:Uncharacterized protein n=1 Tax=Dreissena polymorpha TaxID=45954 RepID=A0A9D4I0Y6_DREPO|nr:hypothetical protein DPMN_044975 [Dreissena polymorpha]
MSPSPWSPAPPSRAPLRARLMLRLCSYCSSSVSSIRPSIVFSNSILSGVFNADRAELSSVIATGDNRSERHTSLNSRV